VTWITRACVRFFFFALDADVITLSASCQRLESPGAGTPPEEIHCLRSRSSGMLPHSY